MDFSKYFSEINEENIDEESLTVILADIEPELLEESFLRSQFDPRKCPNGETVLVVRNPREYVRNTGKSWMVKFDFLVEAFDKLKIKFGTSIKEQITEFESEVRAIQTGFQDARIDVYTIHKLNACKPGAAKDLKEGIRDIRNAGIDLMKAIILTRKITDQKQIKLLLEMLGEIKKLLEKMKDGDDDGSDGDDDEENENIQKNN